MDKEESIRIHSDWWGKCRSCRFWQGTDNNTGPIKHLRWNPGLCTQPDSPLFEQETWTEGHCEKWDSFDIETAFEIMQEDLERRT